MDGLAFQRGSSGGVLFMEDFDAAPPPESPAEPEPEPEVIEPVFTVQELQSAKQQSWEAGYQAGYAEAAGAARTSVTDALAKIGPAVAAATQRAEAGAHQSAEAVARLLLDSIAAAFPALCARHGEGELRAIIRSLLPAIAHEPAITIRVNPADADAVAEEVSRIDLDAGAIRIEPAAAVAAGDIRIQWRNGRAMRNAAALWAEISDILGAAGLLPSKVIKELDYVE
ncbi:MAG: hypothetical protein JO227_24780 [Acetobacteraceae bacterium]|nr:hypothetical protein [Acetobacteraceae bacterium]